ncbi:hypothetical protein J7M22_10120 [Candidatus Poribacteria bacterium]|nr:hypothetical protein [Candidatus Poribacteria bacterium]
MRGKGYTSCVTVAKLSMVTTLLLSLLTGCGENEESNELPELLWQPTAPTGTTFIQVILATPDDRLYIGTSGDGILRSDNGGNSWVRSGLEGYMIRSLVRSGSMLFAGTGVKRTSEYGRLIYREGGLFRSDDGGLHWTLLGFEKNEVLVFVFGTTIYAIVSGPSISGIFRSDDNGDTWHQIPGISAPARMGLHPMAEVNGALFLVNWDGLFRSTDQGKTWQALEFDRWAWEVCSGNSEIFVVRYVGGKQKMIYRSTDLGETWTPIGYLELPSSFLVLDTTLYVGVRGVVRWSEDGGWELVGLEDYDISSLSVSDNYLYAATWSGEVFKTKLPR